MFTSISICEQLKIIPQLYISKDIYIAHVEDPISNRGTCDSFDDWLYLRFTFPQEKFIKWGPYDCIFLLNFEYRLKR